MDYPAPDWVMTICWLWGRQNRNSSVTWAPMGVLQFRNPAVFQTSWSRASIRWCYYCFSMNRLVLGLISVLPALLEFHPRMAFLLHSYWSLTQEKRNKKTQVTQFFFFFISMMLFYSLVSFSVEAASCWISSTLIVSCLKTSGLTVSGLDDSEYRFGSFLAGELGFSETGLLLRPNKVDAALLVDFSSTSSWWWLCGCDPWRAHPSVSTNFSTTCENESERYSPAMWMNGWMTYRHDVIMKVEFTGALLTVIRACGFS